MIDNNNLVFESAHPFNKSSYKYKSISLSSELKEFTMLFNEVSNAEWFDSIKEADEQVKVPIIYANSERWKSIKKDGWIRDVKRKI